MSVGVKICGLDSEAAVAAAVGGGARFAGFVFYKPSPRDLSPERAAKLAAGVAPGIGRVGVFVDPDDALLASVLAKVPLDMIQLHGEETPERSGAIRKATGLKVMKAIKVASETDIQGAKAYLAACDWLMFDAKPPQDAERPGGNALAFDWTLLRRHDWPLPWMLSGGLTVENLAEAARTARASFVDVSSGVETRPGVKDPALIRAFLARAAAL